LHGDVILPLTRNAHAGVFQRRHDAGTILNEACLHKARQKAVERLSVLSEGYPIQIARRGSLKLSGPPRVIWAGPPMGMVQKVPQRPVGAFPARRGDVQRLAGGEFHARDHEMQFHPLPFGVLMAHPGDIVLLGVETGKGQRLQLIHDQALLIFGWRILQGETDHAMGVGPFAVDTIDQIPRPAHVPAQNLGRGVTTPRALRVSEIPVNRTAAATPATGELNQHRAASHARRATRPVPGRSRSVSPGVKRSPPGNDGSQHGPAG